MLSEETTESKTHTEAMAEELKKRLLDFLHELPQKQGELEQLQQHCSSEQLSKQELLAEVDSLRVEITNLQAQLDLTNKALHKCEENFKAAKDSAVKHQLSLEATSRCGEKMKEEAVRLQSENLMLKKQIENLEKESKTESFFRESCVVKQTKTQTLIESLQNQMRDLEKDFKDVERKSNDTLSIGNKNKLLSENKDLTIKQWKEKAESLTYQVTTLTSELESLKLKENNTRPVEQHYVRDIMKEWQNSMNEMKVRTQNFERESEALHQSLEMALQDKIKLQKFEEAAIEKIRMLEAKLEEAMNKESKRNTDCSVQTDLTSAIEVGCQTGRVEVNSEATQTSNSNADLQVKDKEDNIGNKHTTIIHDTLNKCEKVAGDNDPITPARSVQTTPITPTFKYSRCSLSQLISNFQKEKLKQESEESEMRLSQSKDISNMPTQPNLYHNK